MTTAFTATADQIGYYLNEAATTTADIIAVLFQSGGQSDTLLADHGTLAAITGSNTEADFTNYARQTLGTPSRTVDTAGDRVLLSGASPITWTDAGGAVNNTIARIIYCYKPDPASLDSAVLPLLSRDISITTTGVTFQVSLHADGFAVVDCSP